MSKRRIVFVLGMSRSGTSAITRVLALCGAALPPKLASADKANPRGYWEPRKSLYLNDKILHRHGSAFIDPSLRLEEDALNMTSSIDSISEYLSGLPPEPLVVIKDPQIVVLFDLWFQAARRSGFDPAVVIAVRHPQEVIASTSKLDLGPSPQLSAALWLKYNLLAERYTRDLPRVFVDYHRLLDDWRREVGRVSSALGYDLRLDDAVDDFLTQQLRRQREVSIPTLCGAEWLSTTYDALCLAARDQPFDQYALDGVYEAYRASEKDMRLAFADYRRLSKVRRFIGPSVAALGREVLALIHRRENASN